MNIWITMYLNIHIYKTIYITIYIYICISVYNHIYITTYIYINITIWLTVITPLFRHGKSPWTSRSQLRWPPRCPPWAQPWRPASAWVVGAWRSSSCTKRWKTGALTRRDAPGDQGGADLSRKPMGVDVEKMELWPSAQKAGDLSLRRSP